MAEPDLLTALDAALASRARTALATPLDTAGLRALGPEVLARAVFSARGVAAEYASKMKKVIDALAAGELGEGQARTALYEMLDTLGYTPEGGFPGYEGQVPPAVRGSLQDLRSYRRMDLVVRTQLDLMAGAGKQARGHTPDRLAGYPAWELERNERRAVPRDWPARWVVAGGRMAAGRMMALKGDPVWGELGSYDNFSDALGVDHPPWAFNSGMGWREVSRAECAEYGVRGPGDETPEEWQASTPRTLAGPLPAPLPRPQLAVTGMDPGVTQAFQEATHGTARAAGGGTIIDFSDILARDLEKARAAYEANSAGR